MFFLITGLQGKVNWVSLVFSKLFEDRVQACGLCGFAGDTCSGEVRSTEGAIPNKGETGRSPTANPRPPHPKVAWTHLPPQPSSHPSSPRTGAS